MTKFDEWEPTHESDSKTLIMCCTPGIELWVALETVPDGTREDLKAAVQTFPKAIHEKCRCKLCRYGRLFRKSESKKQKKAREFA